MNTETLQLWSQDLQKAALTMTPHEARFLVDSYYTIQDDRIRFDGQIRSMKKDGEPHQLLLWFSEQCSKLEETIKKALGQWASNHPVGKWAMDQIGIGPVISAGLLAHIDITRCPTAGHIWSFAGLSTHATWKKGEKRPWNADFKSLVAWKMGECFVKTCNHPESVYGKFYRERKDREILANIEGGLQNQAAAQLDRLLKMAPAQQKQDWWKRLHRWYAGEITRLEGASEFKLSTEVTLSYSPEQWRETIPMLPPAHIHARARRVAVKLFLSHWFDKMYRHHWGKEPPEPYAIAQLGHAHKIEAI